MDHAAMRVSFSSPFDYANQTRILVVNDLDRDRPEATASAMAALMLAAGGGGFGCLPQSGGCALFIRHWPAAWRRQGCRFMHSILIR